MHCHTTSSTRNTPFQSNTSELGPKSSSPILIGLSIHLGRIPSMFMTLYLSSLSLPLSGRKWFCLSVHDTLWYPCACWNWWKGRSAISWMSHSDLTGFLSESNLPFSTLTPNSCSMKSSPKLSNLDLRLDILSDHPLNLVLRCDRLPNM